MSTHIFIFVRHCDLHFTLLPDLFRQVKANKLLMNKSVKYSPPSRLPIQMLLISPGFLCCVQLPGARFGCAASAETSPHSQGCQERSPGKTRGSLGSPEFSSCRQMCRPGSQREPQAAKVSTLPMSSAKKPGPEPTLSFSDHEGRQLTRERENAWSLWPLPIYSSIKIKVPGVCSE